VACTPWRAPESSLCRGTVNKTVRDQFETLGHRTTPIVASMATTGLDVFDTTLQKTHGWLNTLMSDLGWPEKHTAYLALRATLHALRDRLTVEEVAQLAAQLPMLIRGFYYEGWDPTGKPVRERHKEDFLARIEHELTGGYPIDAEFIARAVFRLLAQRVSDGEIEDVKHILPSEVRALWPARSSESSAA
jgi:uncharacterized protein (DUF2267 family)